MNTRRQSRSVVNRTTIVKIATFTLLLVTAAFLVFTPTHSTEASNPPSGAISPTGPSVVWQGPLTGGACANETTCVEGTNCDTFKLTLTGTEDDWAGKVVNVT